jgi:hypothetical protein
METTRSVCEIGSDHPGTDRLIADIAAAAGGVAEDVIDPSRSVVLTPRYVHPTEEAAKLARAQVMGFYAAADYLGRSGSHANAAAVRDEGARFARRLGVTL